MSQKIVVCYDGSASSENALEFAVKVAKAEGASLIIAHVLEWSPYSFLTPTEIEERHMRREEELKRASAAVLDPLGKKLEGTGVEFTTALRYGHIAETLCDIAKEESASQIILGRIGSSHLSRRLLGSVTSTLVQAGPVPVTVVP